MGVKGEGPIPHGLEEVPTVHNEGKADTYVLAKATAKDADENGNTTDATCEILAGCATANETALFEVGHTNITTLKKLSCDTTSDATKARGAVKVVDPSDGTKNSGH